MVFHTTGTNRQADILKALHFTQSKGKSTWENIFRGGNKHSRHQNLKWPRLNLCCKTERKHKQRQGQSTAETATCCSSGPTASRCYVTRLSQGRATTETHILFSAPLKALSGSTEFMGTCTSTCMYVCMHTQSKSAIQMNMGVNVRCCVSNN